MTIFERLAIKIEKDTGYKLVDFKRTYASIHQRGSGAFTWIATCPISKFTFGSGTPASDLLKQDKVGILEENHLITFEII